jgi:CheY-like chemotaxis protein
VKFTILLVEDSRVQKLANEKILTQAGYLVLMAGSGEDALRLALEASPDLILLDMILPRLNGFEVLQALKRDRATAAVPVIVLSQLTDADQSKVRAGGAAGYFAKSKLAKGVDGETELVELIKKTLRESPGSRILAAHVGW